MTSADCISGQSAISLRIRVPEQRLELLAGNNVIAAYPVSTSKYGLGTEPGSFRTPTGHFVIDEMIGDHAPLGMAFIGRQPSGIFRENGDDVDGVLTRILWLAGLDPENANTRDRYIYIHGTNQEHLIGTPASHGCVRMRNPDVIDLYARVRPGTPVEIIAESHDGSRISLSRRRDVT